MTARRGHLRLVKGACLLEKIAAEAREQRARERARRLYGGPPRKGGQAA